MIHPFRLDGHLIRLEKLSLRHIYELEKIATNPIIWQYLPIEGWKKDVFWTWVYDTLELQMHEKVFAFAVIDIRTDAIVGTTRFQDMDLKHNKTDIAALLCALGLVSQILSSFLPVLKFTLPIDLSNQIVDYWSMEPKPFLL